jgi:hypothetical protein
LSRVMTTWTYLDLPGLLVCQPRGLISCRLQVLALYDGRQARLTLMQVQQQITPSGIRQIQVRKVQSETTN